MTSNSTSRWSSYHKPETVEEALELLRHYDGSARIIGGGTDILVEARRGLRQPIEAIVDATGIAGLDTISHDQNYIVIGCGVTHTRIVSNESVVRYGACLAESCGVIGGPQVRNTGTLAGNVAHALPAGDGTIGLLALGGEVEIASTTGTRWVPAKDTFVGPGKSVIDRHREVLTRLRFKPATSLRPQVLAWDLSDLCPGLQNPWLRYSLVERRRQSNTKKPWRSRSIA